MLRLRSLPSLKKQRRSNTRRSPVKLSGVHLLTFILLGAALACSPDDSDTDPMGSGGAGMASGGGTGMASGGSGAGATTGSGGADTTQLPSDLSAAGIQAFLDAGSYKTWVHDAAPRANSSRLGSHGDSLQVYFNKVAVAAGSQGDPAPGGMLVKEIYDEAGTMQIGVAVSIKQEEAYWVYYCKSTDPALCADGSGETMVFDNSGKSGCSACHGDTVYAPLP